MRERAEQAWQERAIELASLLPDDFNGTHLWDGRLTTIQAERIVDLVQTVKAAFDG